MSSTSPSCPTLSPAGVAAKAPSSSLMPPPPAASSSSSSTSYFSSSSSHPLLLPPSPLDALKARQGRMIRGRSLGLNASAAVASPATAAVLSSVSFDANQSFPRAVAARSNKLRSFLGRSACVRADRLASMASGDLGVSFSGGIAAGPERSFLLDPADGSGDGLADEAAAAAVFNPNKAFVVFDSASGKILVANRLACQLLGRSGGSLAGEDFDRLVSGRERGLEALEEEAEYSSELRRSKIVSGRVVEIQQRSSQASAAAKTTTVSMWIRDCGKGRRVAVMEEVRKVVGRIEIDPLGVITSADEGAGRTFHFEADEMVGSHVALLVPAFRDDDLLQAKESGYVTGRTKDGAAFPVLVSVKRASSSSTAVAVVETEVFCNVSGLVVVDSADLKVESCNRYFSALMFGLPPREIVGKPLTHLLPNLLTDTDLASESKLYLSEEEEDGVLGCRPLSPVEPKEACKENSAAAANVSPPPPLKGDSRAAESPPPHPVSSTPFKNPKPRTPTSTSPSQQLLLPEGRFMGLARHKDGQECPVFYEVRHVRDEGGRVARYCLWLTRDHAAQATMMESILQARDASSLSASSAKEVHCHQQNKSLGQAILAAGSGAAASSSSHADVLPEDKNDHLSGPFFEEYSLVAEIGRGTYGSVYSSYRKSDRRLVVTKFIVKERVHGWHEGTSTSRTPTEVMILCSLDPPHPNIVRALDYFEGPSCFQLVMERHGCGMDLFEFVDREPRLDEPLAAHIFRQVASAVRHLHERCGLLHRDVKDENVVVDERFNCRLIDFGSAAEMPSDPDFRFRTFFGTVEYCSPEVLSGEPYRGPELEAWSLGVLLYTLVFAENPFAGVEETIECRLEWPPRPLTGRRLGESLRSLIAGALSRDPGERMTVGQMCDHAWTRQPVDAGGYRFEDVVRCTPEEANPAEYCRRPTEEGSCSSSPRIY